MCDLWINAEFFVSGSIYLRPTLVILSNCIAIAILIGKLFKDPTLNANACTWHHAQLAAETHKIRAATYEIQRNKSKQIRNETKIKVNKIYLPDRCGERKNNSKHSTEQSIVELHELCSFLIQMRIRQSDYSFFFLSIYSQVFCISSISISSFYYFLFCFSSSFL